MIIRKIIPAKIINWRRRKKESAKREKEKELAVKKINSDLENFNALGKQYAIQAREENLFYCIGDDTADTAFDAHYIYHPAWAARIVKQINPGLHIDISSTLHFCSLLSAFIPVDFYDYRPAILNLDNLNSKRGDLMNLPFADNSIESLSCMHTVEHIGLGRYGDPIDPIGDIKAISELKRVCKPAGSLLFVVPVGVPRIMFNAHRIYDPEFIIQQFEEFDLIDFSLVQDDNKFIKNADLSLGKKQNYGCGCFWFKKK